MEYTMISYIKYFALKTAKLSGMILFSLLFVVNITIVLSKANLQDIEIFGMKVEFLNNAFARTAQEGDDGSGPGGGRDAGNGPGDHWAVSYYRDYSCGTWYQPLRCPCWEIRCHYGGAYCIAATTCPEP